MWPHSRQTLPLLPPTLPSVATSLPFLAVIVPLLPPITRNVTFVWAANRLECGIHAVDGTNHDVKSGKNGNVDSGGQHCHPG